MSHESHHPSLMLLKGWLLVLFMSSYAPLGFAAECEGGPGARFTISGAQYCHTGGGRFRPKQLVVHGRAASAAKIIDLHKIQHSHDRKTDPDVPVYTDITLPGSVPELMDRNGREYALITLYNIDPPLDGVPSAEAGVHRGIDFRDATNLVRSAYSNYVSPVFTNDEERKPVPGHPIGHFYVKVDLPGYPTILTGMTTTVRADDELVNLTLARQLGIGGVLLTPQPGRLNAAKEAMEELNLRQRELRVVDGLFYELKGGRNVGPSYIVDDGNVVFARFRVPRENAKDALTAFLGFVDRGDHNKFGSLLSRPSKGNGAGCSAFAMSWLKASGIIPFVDESKIPRDWKPEPHESARQRPLWANFYRRIGIPWAHIGCDSRVGLKHVPPQAADYSIHDNLLYKVPAELIAQASQGLAEKIRKEHGQVIGTLFRFGALTPLRDLFIASKRKDPKDQGNYEWVTRPKSGLVVGFWDNGRFSEWVKKLWAEGGRSRKSFVDGKSIRLVKEGRFLGVEVDALDTPRLSAALLEPSSALGDRGWSSIDKGDTASTCRSVFSDLIHR